MSDLEITKQQFCQQWGISAKMLERHFEAGMPHRRDGNRKVMIPLPDGAIWLREYDKAQGSKQLAPTDYDEAKSRKMAAEAELAELELAKARDELMTRADCERIVTDERNRVDARLQSLAPRAAGAVLGAQTLAEAQARIAPIVEEVRDELRNAGPLDTEADDSDGD